MSTASRVSETRGLTGDAAWRTLAATGCWRLVRDAARRLRAADGFSHARSLAFAISLVLVQGLIALVGLAVSFRQDDFGRTILGAIGEGVPGPAGGLLANAFTQARRLGLEHRWLPLAAGLLGTLVTATTAMGQIIRGVNRLYGIEKDGSFVRKYRRALLLALVALAALIGAGAVITAGRSLAGATGDGVAWRLLRWPLALALGAAAFGGILRWAPSRTQPHWSWLVFGGVIGVAAWTIVTLAFSLAFRASSSFGLVYGPLAGVVALQLWTFVSSVAVFFGAAVSAQLEAVRAPA